MLKRMKRINVMVDNIAKAALFDYKGQQGYNTLDEASEAFLIEFRGVMTYKGGWIKTHVGCGGSIRYVENIDPNTPQTFDMQCWKCGAMVCADEVAFTRGH